MVTLPGAPGDYIDKLPMYRSKLVILIRQVFLDCQFFKPCPSVSC